MVLAVITSPKGVLIAHRRDQRPPWTFPGGDINPGESPAGAAIRKALDEARVAVTPLAVLGSRVHPRTARHMVYLACRPEDDQAEPEVGDNDDLDQVEYAGLDVVRDRMPDMFDPVRHHLEATLGSIERY